MSVTHAVPGKALTRRERFRAWRRSRPTWGVIFVLLAGAELYGLTMSPAQINLVEGVAGISGLVIFGVCLALGLVCLFQPAQHAVTGSLCLITALASLPLCNLGGFGIGMLMGLHGSSLMISWRPPEQVTDAPPPVPPVPAPPQ